jgi:hypothetical protein
MQQLACQSFRFRSLLISIFIRFCLVVVYDNRSGRGGAFEVEIDVAESNQARCGMGTYRTASPSRFA